MREQTQGTLILQLDAFALRCGEDKSRIRTTQEPQIFALARNFSLNLYRDHMFENMAQAQRLCSFSLDTLKELFRMK